MVLVSNHWHNSKFQIRLKYGVLLAAAKNELKIKFIHWIDISFLWRHSLWSFGDVSLFESDYLKFVAVDRFVVGRIRFLLAPHGRARLCGVMPCAFL
jgi:hypothetical protein